MKIAVSAKGRELSSLIDERFGRAEFFVVAEPGSQAISIIDNSTNAQSAGGAGIRTAEQVVNVKAEAVVTGNIGPKALQALKAAGLRVFLVGGSLSKVTVQDALDRYQQGGLEEK